MKFNIVLVFVLTTFSSAAFAGHHEDPNIDAIKQAINNYVKDFIARDYPGIASHFQAPMMQRTANGITVATTSKAVENDFRNYLENVQDGYAYSTIDRVDVTKIESTIYYADIDYTRFNNKDQMLHEGRGIYFFSNADGAWRMFYMQDVARE